VIRRLLLLLAFVAFGYATAAAQRPPARTQRPATLAQQPPTPCTTATPDCTEWIAVGGGPGRSLVYRNLPLDTRNEAITRAVIVVHGAGRDADNYFRSALAGAFLAGALQTAVVISPRMASGADAGCRDSLAQNEISWDCDLWRSGGPSVSHPAVTSFDFLDEILRKLARRDVFPNLRGIVVTGHSAGGQVTNRYGMSSKTHETLGVPVQYVVANPSSYAWPTNERPTGPAAWPLQAGAPGFVPAVAADAPAFRPLRDGRGCTAYNAWPYGFLNRTGYVAALSDSQLMRQLVSRPFTYLLGENDILPLSGFDGSCEAMAQGPTRQARGQAYAKYVNERLGGHHEVVVVTGCGHNGRCIYTSEPWLRIAFPGP
jgi:pimeloyl-ACP methyl ester carboxylesterase